MEGTMSDFWKTALLAPLAELGQKLYALLPNVLAMTIILAGGILVAWLTGTLLERLLRAIGIDRLSDRAGLSAALVRGGVKTDPSRLIGRAGYWLVLVFVVMAALGALNVQPVSHFIQSFLAYLPHLFTALLILIGGYLLSNFVSQGVLIAAVNAGLPPARSLAASSRWAVRLVAAAMALEQLGIAQQVVVVGFGILLGGIVLAAAIAFGLGARDLAKSYLEQRIANKVQEGNREDLRHL
jgi:hypothetical protein